MSFRITKLRPRSHARVTFNQDKAPPLVSDEKTRMFLMKWVWPPAAVVLTTLMCVAAFPPVDLPETAYIFLVPYLLWTFYKPAPRVYLASALLTGFVSWVILLWWLRHVTLAGTLFLSAYTGLYLALWLGAARWMVPKLDGKAFNVRLLGMLGLAGLWVVLEYLRGVLFTGFPWLPLAASQWQRPALLQVLAYTGYYGVSFVLVFLNLGLAFYIHRFIERRRVKVWYERICPEFYVALLLLVGAASGLIWTEAFRQQRKPLFSAAIVQPYIRQDLKWDEDEAINNLETIAKQTIIASYNGGEVVFWPESVTPWPVKGDMNARLWAEGIATRIEKPIVMGNMAREGDTLYNIIGAVEPDAGLVEPYYAKRRLVPFGEYVPLPQVFFWVDKFVPLAGTFAPGDSAGPVPVNIDGRRYRAGPLICYEDVFTGLARDSVRAGIDFLFVATNNAWYGEEGNAYQHAAHSVLRAVETRRPVIRCGNGGWSGWIDEYGNLRQILMRPRQEVYFRGSDIIEVDRDLRWRGELTFYARFGDWFVSLCGFFVVAGCLYVQFTRGEAHAYKVGDLLRPKSRETGDNPEN